MSSERWTPQDLADYRNRSGVKPKALEAEPKPSKYRNKKTEVNGEVFDSKKEAARWGELLLLQRRGHIRNLKRQVRIPLKVNDEKVCDIVMDFVYEELYDNKWREIFDDTKGMRTPVYLLKKRLVRAILGREIRET